MRRQNARSLYRTAECAVLLYWYKLLVAYLPYATWKKTLFNARSGTTGGNTPGDPEAIVRAFKIAKRNSGISTTCLQRSLALYTVLRRRHIPAKLVIGVDALDRFPECHAWVETDGRMLLEDPLTSSKYLPFSDRQQAGRSH